MDIKPGIGYIGALVGHGSMELRLAFICFCFCLNHSSSVPHTVTPNIASTSLPFKTNAYSPAQSQP